MYFVKELGICTYCNNKLQLLKCTHSSTSTYVSHVSRDISNYGLTRLCGLQWNPQWVRHWLCAYSLSASYFYWPVIAAQSYLLTAEFNFAFHSQFSVRVTLVVAVVCIIWLLICCLDLNSVVVHVRRKRKVNTDKGRTQHVWSCVLPLPVFALFFTHEFVPTSSHS